MKNIFKILIILGFIFLVIVCHSCRITQEETEIINDSNSSEDTTGIVIVGMEYSQTFGPCPGAEFDANTANKLLLQYGKPTVLINSDANKKSVITALKNASTNELMIFWYSGHGGSDPIGNVSQEPDGKNEYLCLNDTYMLDNEIWDIITAAKGRVFCIFDCCHSETMYRVPTISFKIPLTETFQSSRNPVNLLVWSGCADDTYSYGSSNGGVLSNAIRDSWSINKSYDEVWKLILEKTKNSRQIPKKTTIGTGFETKIFK